MIERLRALDTGAVSDALDRLGLPGVVLGLSAQSAARRIAGRAVTVRLGPDDGEPGKRHLCTAAVEASGPDEVLVIANDGRSEVAAFGGLLATAAAVRGTAGVVIDGVCRDLDEIREADLPLYSRGAVPVTARGRIAEIAWDVPVEVSGIAVRPGDYVIADASGVAVVPADRAEEIVSLAETIARKEQAMAAAIRDGEPVSAVMGASYELLARRTA